VAVDRQFDIGADGRPDRADAFDDRPDLRARRGPVPDVAGKLGCDVFSVELQAREAAGGGICSELGPRLQLLWAMWPASVEVDADVASVGAAEERVDRDAERLADEVV
jgi:hypothetical protein